MLGSVPHAYSHMGNGSVLHAADAAAEALAGTQDTGAPGIDSPAIRLCIEADPTAAAQEHEHAHTERTPALSISAAEAAERVLQKLGRVHALAGTVDLSQRGFGGGAHHTRSLLQLSQGTHPRAAVPVEASASGATGAQGTQAIHGDAEWQANVAEVVVTEFHHYCVPRR